MRPALWRAPAHGRGAAQLPDLLPDRRRRRPTAEPRALGHGSTCVHHRGEHDAHPVGDDDWLESLREGDRIRIGRWSAPFDVVRRYLVTGQVEAGRGRALAHDAIVNAMTQIRRWGPNGVVFGDQPEWAAARAAVSALMERYADGSSLSSARNPASSRTGTPSSWALASFEPAALAGDQVVRLLRHRAAGLAAGRPDRLLGLLAAEALERAGDDDGLAG